MEFALVVGLVLASAVVVDLLVLAVVWRVAARRVRQWLPSAERVSVAPGGFPILFHLARGQLGRVRLTAHRVQVAEKVQLDELRVDARGVALGRADGTIRGLRGCGVIGYRALSAAAPGVTVSYGGNGTLLMTARFGAIRASASARPTIGGDRLRLDPEALSAGRLGAVSLAALPVITYRLLPLPQGLDFVLTPAESGLDISFVGTDVVMPRQGRHPEALT